MTILVCLALLVPLGVLIPRLVVSRMSTTAGVALAAVLTLAVVAGVVYAVAPLPHRMAGAHAERKGAIREGARVALGTEPLRSLMAITTVMGHAIVTVTLLLPDFARDVLDQDSLAASGLNAFMSIGMVTTSMYIATRWTPTGWPREKRSAPMSPTSQRSMIKC